MLICSALERRIESLREVMNERRSFYAVDDRAGDVAVDEAYSGK